MVAVCRFFAHGTCRNGDSCTYIHEPSSSTGQTHAPVALVLPTTKLSLNLAGAPYRNKESDHAPNCRHFLQGKCNKGKECRYTHPPAMLTPQQVDPDIASPDSRATIPCMFLSRPRGCQNSSCPYLHVVNAPAGAKDSGQDLEANIEEEDQEHGDDFIRNLLGATVCFGEFGHTLKVSFPSDFSLVCITGLVPGTTTEDFVEVLREFGYDLTAECVRISKLVGSSEPKATVKVEDPLFAQGLCSKLKTQRSNLKAAPIPINARLLSCRKVYISWHKPTRSVWVNFGSGEVANRVAQKFRDGRYKCLGQSVESSLGKCSPGRGGQRASSNPSAWTIILSDVPSNSTSRDIEEAIKSQYDKPRHVELGPCSYQASDAEISVIVRTQLEEHGLLESFYLASTNKGKRTKATALFADEADAKSACVLKNRPLDILGKGKITITMIQSVKIKVSTPVYIATKSEIDVRIKGWKERRLGLHAYPDAIQRFTTLKVEGDSAQDVANARKTLDQILSGIILRTGDSVVWDSSLSSNGNAYKKVKSIAKELHVLIIRNKTQRQLQYYGPIAKVQDIVNQVTDMIREEPSTNRDIQQHQDTIIKGNQASEVRPMLEIASAAEGKCPICLDDEPDTPIQTLCKHSYCFECFENCCRSAASTNKEEFRVECQGDGGNCTVVFKLAELKDHLSSSAFELVLQSSFEEYIQKHPKDFHYCPTPDCGYVYRCTPVSSFKPTAYRCPNCLEPICTFCHARHGDYTCAQYQDIESGGYEALEKLKKELNIKDCPTCKTSMEKTEGCNHITCGGCRAHICWVCMAVFRTSGPCYDHMREQHGSIGLEDLDHYLADW